MHCPADGVNSRLTVRTNVPRELCLASGLWLFMAAIQRLLQTTSRSASSRVIFQRPCRLLTNVRYNSTAAPAPAPVNATPQSEPVPTSPLPDVKGHDGTTDWSRSYAGLSVQPFSKEVAETLQAPLDRMDVEIKPGAFLLYSRYLHATLGFQKTAFYICLK